MQFKIQLTIINPEDGVETIEEIALLDKENTQIEDLGLSLSESKSILSSLQQKIVVNQTESFIEAHKSCPDCGKNFRKKGSYPIVFRTLFGDLPLSSTRFYSCSCKAQKQITFSPLSGLIKEYTSPERLYLETKWASLIPFEKTAQMLKDVLPMNATVNRSSIRNHLIKVAEKDEAELGEEAYFFINSCPRDWANHPRPEGPISVGLDGGYLRNWEEKKTYFEVIAGKSVPRDQEDKFFGFVDTYHSSKPKRRVYETLKSQGMQENQQIEFFSDGAGNLRDLQLYLNPHSEHYLDWFHITMRITVLKQYSKGIKKVDKETGEKLLEGLNSVKWYLWHGNTYKALQEIEFLIMELEIWEKQYEHLKKFKKTLDEFHTYIQNNEHFIPNYGERYRNEEIITTSFVESAINQVVAKRFNKKQQMQWTKKGAHLLLLTRTKVINEELADCFRKWYPKFQIQERQLEKNAA